MGGGGKGGGSSAPAAPNYLAIAQQQEGIDKRQAEALTAMNRPTQKNPFGSISWKKDANGNWTQTETWDPRIMAGYYSAQKLKENSMADLKNQRDFSGPDAVKWDPNSGKAASDAMYRSYMSRAGKQQARDTEALTTKLRQQGLQPGTEAFDRAMRNQLTSQGDVNAKANLDSIVLGGQEARANYASALAGQNQAYAQADKDYSRLWDTAGAANNLYNSQYRPTFTGFSGATGYNPADMMGASQAQYQAKMGEYSAGQQGKGNLLNAGASLGGSFLVAK